MNNLFGGINLTWKKLIISAIITGIYTGVVNLIPILSDTSFTDIAVSFEVWVLFGTIIIMNSKSAKDSSLKCFIFFLISQPLVYLVESPFLGIEVFSYYDYWFKWTILTIPMGYLGYFIKKDKWYGLLMVIPITLFVNLMGYTYLLEVIFNFPNHLLTYLFCIISPIIYSLYLFKDKRLKLISLIVNIITIIGVFIYCVINPKVYNIYIVSNDLINDKWDVFTDTKDDVSIIYSPEFEEYSLVGNFTHTGKVNITLEDESGNKYKYIVEVNSDDYKVKKITN